jgi:transcriptional regulator with XRE-family HTH domain
MASGHRLLQPTAAKMSKSRYTVRYERFLQVLRNVRKEAGLTQAQVARHFGTYASFVSKVESGERRVDIVELTDFCQLYGVRLSVFLKKAGLE